VAHLDSLGGVPVQFQYSLAMQPADLYRFLGRHSGGLGGCT
jgi:hypothetical protein